MSGATNPVVTELCSDGARSLSQNFCSPQQPPIGSLVLFLCAGTYLVAFKRGHGLLR
jgi:hypothetical protein